jgi:hypothetical protein
MYFFKKNGKQFLDMQGNLILSHNKELIQYKAKSAIPHAVYNAKYLLKVDRYNFISKVKTSLIALRFIWIQKNARS